MQVLKAAAVQFNENRMELKMDAKEGRDTKKKESIMVITTIIVIM